LSEEIAGMDSIGEFLALAAGHAWGPPLIVLSAGGDMHLTLLNRGIQFRGLRPALQGLSL